MRSPIAYVPRRTRLAEADALSASVYLGSLALVAFLYPSPIVIGAAGIAALCAGLAGGAGRALAVTARWGTGLGVFIVVVNGLVAQRGDTVIVNGLWLPLLGSSDVSAEALTEGAVLALRILVVMLAFAVHSACIDPDRVLRMLRPLARRSALTATLIARLVPLAAADYARLGEAAALRGPAAAPVGRGAMARRLVAGSLDRAVDVAATLELRGYAHGAPRSRGGGRRSRYARRFLAGGLAVVALGIAGRVAGLGGFDPYPTVSIATGAPTLVLAAAIVLVAALPLVRTPRRRTRD
jgi:energy-coupling factor transport system permease protein